jgi:Secretion system C-terminal sorting domain
MKHKKLHRAKYRSIFRGVRAGVVVLLLGLAGDLQAQEATTSTGGVATGTGGTVSYSIGQVFYTAIGTNGSATQGVQQAYVISTVTGIPSAIGIELSVYPNPTTDLLNLNVGNYDNGKLSYQLYDLQGKLLENKKIVGSSSVIKMKNLPSSTYFLNVANDQAKVKTFRIIKN